MLGDAFARAQAASLARFPSHRIGSTATALVLARSPGAFAWQVAAAWVGDSRAILVPKDGGGGGGVDVGDGAVALTEDHRTDLPRERERVLKVQAAEKDAPRGKRKTVLARRVCDKTGMVKGGLLLFCFRLCRLLSSIRGLVDVWTFPATPETSFIFAAKQLLFSIRLKNPHQIM